MSEPWLAVSRAGRHLHENVGLGRAQPLDGGRPAPHAGLLRDRPAGGGEAQDSGEVESVPVVDEPVARVGETDDGDADAVFGGEPLGLRVDGPDEPSAHRPEADHPDPQRPQPVTHGRG